MEKRKNNNKICPSDIEIGTTTNSNTVENSNVSSKTDFQRELKFASKRKEQEVINDNYRKTKSENMYSHSKLKLKVNSIHR